MLELRIGIAGATLAAFIGITNVAAAPLVLNEYNAVSGSNFLNGGDELSDEDGNIPPPEDPFFGRIAGNGGDWFEMIVIADGIDLRGWELEISDDGVVQPRLVLSQAAVWADVRAGTIVTIAENVPDDASYDPVLGDWWIHAMAADPADGGTGVYVTAMNFPVSNDNWQLSIYDSAGVLVYGPAGEGIIDDGGVPSDISVNSREVFALQGAPDAATQRASPFYNDAADSSFGAPNTVGGTQVQDLDPLRLGLPVPDGDGDGIGEDGDRSGVPGDNPCSGGATQDCDDNCPFVANAAQADVGGIAAGPPDGIGDACQCGDVNNNGRVTRADARLLFRFLNGLIPSLPAPEKCSVVGDDGCDALDVRVINRAISGLPPGVAQVCEAGAGPGDLTDLIFDPERVLEIAITMDPADWETLRMQTRDFPGMIADPECGLKPWDSPFTWFNANVNVDGELFTDVGVRKKGFLGSLSVEKPALKLDLARFVAGQTLHGMTRFTLNNSLQDASFAKQCLSFGIFAAAGIPVPRCNFAQISVNGMELGIFVNVEDVNERFLARHYADATGKLFEAEVSDFWPGPWTGTWDPDSEAAEDGNEEIVDLATVLEQTPAMDLAAALDTRIDRAQFIHYWALEALVGHWDGYTNNMNNAYVYFDPLDGLARFMPWDMDFDFLPDNDSIYAIRAALARKMYNLAETRGEYLSQVQVVLDTVWMPEAYSAEIARVDALLSPRLSALGMQAELNQMLARQADLNEWIAGRRADIEAELAAPPASVADVQIPHLCEMGVAAVLR